MKDFSLQLEAGVPREIGFPGSAFHVQEASGPVKLSFDNGDSVTREKTQGAKVKPYQLVRIESSIAQAVIISLGDSVTVDGRASVGIQEVSASVVPANGINEVPDVIVSNAAVQLLPSSQFRQEILVAVPEDAANGVRVGSAAVASDRGLRVGIGQTLALTTEAAVFAIRDGAEDVTVSIIEQIRS